MSEHLKYITEEIILELQQQMARGNCWAVIEGDQLPRDTLGMRFFNSSFKAEKFCTENLFVRDAEDGELVDLNLQCHTIHNLLEEFKLKINEGNLPAPVMPAGIEELLRRHNIELEDSSSSQDPLFELAHGRIVPAMRKVVLVPEQLACAYQIVLHHHQYHSYYYEVGHSASVLDSFAGLVQAEAALEERSKQLPSGNSRSSTELLLICCFQHDGVRICDEGYPMYNTGAVIKSVSFDEGELVVNDNIDPKAAIEFYQRFFVRLAGDSGKLMILDDRLEEIPVLPKVQSFWSEGFYTHFNSQLLLAIEKRQAGNQKNLATQNQQGQLHQKAPPSPGKRPGI